MRCRGRRGVSGMGCAAGGIAALGCRGGLGLGEPAGVVFAGRRGEVEVELSPLRARDRPLVFVAELVSAMTGADGELHRRLVHHPVIDVLEPVVEEAQLIAAPILAVERMVVRAAMDAQLLML